MNKRKLAGLVALLASLVAVDARAGDSEDVALLREQIRQLDQKLRILERKQEIKDEEAAAAAKTAAKVTLNDKGLTLASGDSANSLRIRGLVQADARLYLSNGGVPNKNAFVLRRARIILEGKFAKNFEYQVVPEFGGSAFALQDANVNFVVKPSFQIKAGKFKAPLGLELLQSDSWAFFTERSLVTNLVPNRDIGVQIWGDVLENRVQYQVGVFNGLADGGNSTTNTDFDADKDLIARVFAQPFKNEGGSFLQGLGVGLSGSLGRSKTSSGLTSGYRTDGQQSFFAFKSGVLQDGQLWRVSPQAYYYNGPVGVLGEYVLSESNARLTTTSKKFKLTNKAWQIAAGYVLTGEDSSFAGVVPSTTFDPANGKYGALEVVGRVSQLDIDDAAFPTLADPAAAASKATAFGLGFNWYPAKAVRFSLDYFNTKFDTGAAKPTNAVLKEKEQSIISRLQLTF